MIETLIPFITYGLGGMMGALIKYLIDNEGMLEAPSIKIKNKEKYLDLGVISPLLIGTSAGIIGDSNPVNAFFFGAVAQDFIKKILDSFNGQVGVKVGRKK